MGRRKFVLIDFKKREERAALQKLVPEIGMELDKWLHDYDCGDATPPNESEAKELEEARIAEFLLEYDTRAGQLRRVDADEHAERRVQVIKNLDKRRGRLFRKYSDQVSALKNQAADTMQYCVDTFGGFEESLGDVLPTSEAELDKAFEGHLEQIRNYIESTFPDGLAGMDSYDDALPDGLPAYPAFKEMVEAKKEEYKAKNTEAIPGAVEKVKASSKDMFKDVINKAVETAIEEIVEDLSDDVLPYLDEATMQGLRDELIAAAKEYGASRIES
mmetsp:Transcript_3237/g.4662  ORF Transcript_3237/g.4662 Transcript_3237/m.4662 type:complete len:274 (+) Transcript_3237:97-918(+)